MYHVSIELQKQEWKFGRTRNAAQLFRVLPNFHECFHNSIETWSTCLLFLLKNTTTRKMLHSFFECSQTFTSVSIIQQKHGVHVSYSFQKTPRRAKGKQLDNIGHQNVNSLCSRHHYVTGSCVSPSSYINTIFNQSARVLFSTVF